MNIGNYEIQNKTYIYNKFYIDRIKILKEVSPNIKTVLFPMKVRHNMGNMY